VGVCTGSWGGTFRKVVITQRSQCSKGVCAGKNPWGIYASPGCLWERGSHYYGGKANQGGNVSSLRLLVIIIGQGNASPVGAFVRGRAGQVHCVCSLQLGPGDAISNHSRWRTHVCQAVDGYDSCRPAALQIHASSKRKWCTVSHLLLHGTFGAQDSSWG
jgi:hypothetical protein